MDKTTTLQDIQIRTELQSGDLGFVIHRHGALYGAENGYGVQFEVYVAMGLCEFYKNYDADRDCVWICEHQGKMIGFLLLMHRENNAAQLRYFYLDADYRGIGLGKKMMALFMDFLQKKQYNSCYLWTTHEQLTAIALYEKYGFRLTEEKESTAFGKSLREQRFDLQL